MTADARKKKPLLIYHWRLDKFVTGLRRPQRLGSNTVVARFQESQMRRYLSARWVYEGEHACWKKMPRLTNLSWTEEDIKRLCELADAGASLFRASAALKRPMESVRKKKRSN
jgi:hypothetical protein